MGWRRPPKLGKKLSNVSSSKFQRKADSDQNDLREESVFLRNFEEIGRKLKKSIEFFLSWGLSPPDSPPSPNPQPQN